MILVHAGIIGKPTLCGIAPDFRYTTVKSTLMTNCRNCQKKIIGKVGLTSDGFVLLGSGVFVEKGATTEVVRGELWKVEHEQA